MINVKQSEGLDVAESIASDVADLVLEFGGSLSGEHGDGILRGVFTERMFGPELTEAFRELKRTFDPRGLLNPGKIIDTPPLRDNLRLGPTPSTCCRRPISISAPTAASPAPWSCATARAPAARTTAACVLRTW